MTSPWNVPPWPRVRRSSSSSTTTKSPSTAVRSSASASNCSNRRASARWLRSWNARASSYRRRAASCVVGRRRLVATGGPRVGRADVRVVERERLRGRDVGGLEQVAGAGRLGLQPGGLAGGLGERRVQVGRVVELDELGGRLDDLGLAHPLAGGLVEVPAAAAERQVGRDREVVGVLVDEGEPADVADAVAVALDERLELVGGLDEEVGPLEGGVGRELTQVVAARVHPSPPSSPSTPVRATDSCVQPWYSRSAPIRSRRNIEWWRSKSHSPARWPSARAPSSASSLSSVP